MPTDELWSNDFWDVQEALVVQNIFDILPVGIAWLLCSNLPSLVVLILEFLQLQPHWANAGLVGSFVYQLVLKQFLELA